MQIGVLINLTNFFNIDKLSLESTMSSETNMQCSIFICRILVQLRFLEGEANLRCIDIYNCFCIYLAGASVGMENGLPRHR